MVSWGMVFQKLSFLCQQPTEYTQYFKIYCVGNVGFQCSNLFISKLKEWWIWKVKATIWVLSENSPRLWATLCRTHWQNKSMENTYIVFYGLWDGHWIVSPNMFYCQRSLLQKTCWDSLTILTRCKRELRNRKAGRQGKLNQYHTKWRGS